MEKSRVAALLCADLHLSEKAPLARSAEPDWFAAMQRQLGQLTRLQQKHSEEGLVPILIAGDIFDKWNSSACLINFALTNLPSNICAICGQHDLPLHNIDDIQRSAYWTLVEAKRIAHLYHPGLDTDGYGINKLIIQGFPFGIPITPIKPHSLCINIALIHAYIWMPGKEYDGASQESRVKAWIPKLKGYDVVCFGDNHKPFDYTTKSGTKIYNAGGFFRRRSDERTHRPSVGILYDDGSIERHYLDCSEDKFLEEDEIARRVEKAINIDATEFIKELEGLGDKALDFQAAVLHWIENNNISSGVKRQLLEAVQ